MLRPPKAKLSLTSDVVIFTVRDQQLQVVVLERDAKPFAGYLALPGGFVWHGETTAEAAQRILDAKVGAQNVYCEQLYTFDAPDRDPRGRIVSVAYYALVPPSLLDHPLYTGTRLLPAHHVGQLSFDHNDILSKAVNRLRNKLLYSNIAYSVLPELFTFAELQMVYEAVLGHPLDKRNFRKKIQSLDLVVPTTQKTSNVRHRPAMLYKFKKHGYTELDEPAF